MNGRDARREPGEASKTLPSEPDTGAIPSLEEGMWSYERRGDGTWFDRHVHRDFVEVGRSGRRHGRDDFFPVDIAPFEATLPLPGFAMRRLAPGCVMTTYDSEAHFDAGTEHAHRCSIWLHEDGRWQLLHHQGTPCEKASGRTASSRTTLPERMETPRLILRRPIAADAESSFERYATDPEVVRYLTWTSHASVEETRAFIESEQARWEDGPDAGGCAWTILRKPEKDARGVDGDVAGMIDLRIDGFRAEIGYVLARACWGQGLMSEALAAVRDAALALPAIHRIQLVCDVDNSASARVMEKAGFEREGVLRSYCVHPNVSNVPRDSLCYAFVRR